MVKAGAATSHPPRSLFMTVLIWFIPLLRWPLPLSSPQSSQTELNSVRPEGIRLEEVMSQEGPG